MLVVLLVLVTDAAAIPADQVDRAAYLIRTSRPAEAAHIATAALEVAADDVVAQHLYIRTRLLLDEAEVLRQQYRSWQEAAPADPIRRALRATVIRGTDDRAAWCDEAWPLVEPRPEAAGWATDWVRLHLAGPCGGDPVDALAVLRGLAGADARRWAALLEVALERGPVETWMLDPIRAVAAEAPSELVVLRSLWRKDASGPALREARRVVMGAAEGLVDSARPRELYAAVRVLKRAGQPHADVVVGKWLALDPGAQVSRPGRIGIRSELASVRRDATYEGQLAVIDEIGPPTYAPDLAYWQTRRAFVLEGLGRGDEALAAMAAAHMALPTSQPVARAYFRSAVRLGIGLEAALAAVDTMLERTPSAPTVRPMVRLPPRVVPGRGLVRDEVVNPTLDEWGVEAASWEGELMLLRGMLQRRLGRAEAVVTLRQALFLGAPPEVHLELGLSLGADGWEHLVRGLEVAPGGLAASEARDRVRALYRQRGLWHPGGFEGWLADHREREPAEDQADPTNHPLVGKPFPVDVVRVDGKEFRLSELEGRLVVDLWSTRCGPCIDGMPHLGELAERYAGRVGFIGVSVDRRERVAHRFFAGGREAPFPMAWGGTAVLSDVGIRSIPAQFVLDEEHRVVACVRGYQGHEDRRLDAILEGMVGQP